MYEQVRNTFVNCDGVEMWIVCVSWGTMWLPNYQASVHPIGVRVL